MSFAFYGFYEDEAPFVLSTLTLVHLLSFISFAIWAWGAAPTFTCANIVHLMVFGHRVRVTGWIRYIVLAILGFWSTGISLILISGAVSWLYAFWTHKEEHLFTERKRLQDLEASSTSPQTEARRNSGSMKGRPDLVLGGSAFALGFLIFGIVMAELMIATHDIVPQGSEWSFGQIAAFILLITPVFTLARVIRDDYIRKSPKPIERRPPAVLWKVIQDWMADKGITSASVADKHTDAPDELSEGPMIVLDVLDKDAVGVASSNTLDVQRPLVGTSNPDIDGIGIRVSLYAQGAITLLIYAISPDDTIFDSWWSTLVTALSLQLAALVSWSSISLYHAVLVTWLSFPALIMSFAFFGMFYVEDNAPPILLVLTYVHGATFIGFTLWVWATAPMFTCPDVVHLVIVGQHVRVTGWIRYIVLCLMSIWALGGVVASVIGVLFFLARQPAINRLSARVRNFEAVYIIPRKPPETRVSRNERVLGGAFASFAFLVFALIMAELMIASHNVVSSDNGWGFGQIVAFVLLLMPVSTAVRVIYADYTRKSTKSLDERPLASLWRQIRYRKWKTKADPERIERANADKRSSESALGSYELVSGVDGEPRTSPRASNEGHDITVMQYERADYGVGTEEHLHWVIDRHYQDERGIQWSLYDLKEDLRRNKRCFGGVRIGNFKKEDFDELCKVCVHAHAGGGKFVLQVIAAHLPIIKFEGWNFRDWVMEVIGIVIERAWVQQAKRLTGRARCTSLNC
ncbi:hypothetical protein EUX98_g6679 [Antrodiella citrinella]|uniref:Transmembrane protein n=1 Tax=Antrodiella citrinella TaxID=2447956 RepID=A0A4S4MNP1_9APHY|nr:hypothetical protein EUX98_g6679 [Antrodiella citrinella]